MQLIRPLDYIPYVRNRPPTKNEYIQLSNCISQLREVAKDLNITFITAKECKRK